MKIKNIFPITAMLLILFVAGCKKDDDSNAGPVVTSTNPVNVTTGIAINSKISATFSEAMDSTTITAANFTLKQGTTDVPGAVTYKAATATYSPTANLEANKIYTATITTGAKDISGKSLEKNYTWTFTTGALADISVPTVILSDPANNATGVSLNRAIVATFSEPMDQATMKASTFTLQQGSTAVSGAITCTATTATFTPAVNLEANKIYTATITTGAKDLAGNALAANKVWSFTTLSTTASLAIVDLGGAGNYVILAKTAINNTPTSAITGDLGLSPAATSYITGFDLTNATGYATASQVTGKIYAADMASPTSINLTTAVNNMITAYNDAAGRPSPAFSELGTGNIGGRTLTPGLYKWTSTVTLPSDVTLSGGANDVWIFQIAGDLTMSPAVKLTLTGGAQAKNIFWQVAGKATFGTTSHFAGVILSLTSITFQTGASLNGRALAQTAVILDGNAVTKP